MTGGGEGESEALIHSALTSCHRSTSAEEAALATLWEKKILDSIGVYVETEFGIAETWEKKSEEEQTTGGGGGTFVTANLNRAAF